MTRLGLTIALFVSYGLASGAAVDPRERIFFWKENYTELTAKDDSRAAIAQETFSKLVKISGSWPDKEPKLLIIKENPYNITLPIALPDGWVVLSRNVLDICFKRKQYAQDRLAFVLAHEISHHRSDDFWHVKFFQTLEHPGQQGQKNQKVIDTLKSLTKQTDKILATELRADELAIVYMLMAGFDTDAIVSNLKHDSFFNEWVKALDPARFTTREASSTHPSAQQRTTAVRARLQQVIDKSHLFNLGLWFYQAGAYENAIHAFDDFRQYYPGREVLHNLATSHHQLAIQHFRPGPDAGNQIPFRYSISIDPVNRARNTIYRSNDNSQALYAHHIEQAIKFYEQAIDFDPEYLPAYSNLTSAYLIKNQPYKAIARLQDAEQVSDGNAFILNNMGIAFYMTGNKQKARHYLHKAITANGHSDMGLYNMAVLALRDGDEILADKYRKQYLTNDKSSYWARLLSDASTSTNLATPPPAAGTTRQREKLAKVEVGTYLEEIPAAWKKPKTVQSYTLNNTEHKLLVYGNGITTVTAGNEIRVLVAGHNYRGKSLKNISVGKTEQDVLKSYGQADEVYWTTRGKRLAYHELGLTFYLTDNRVDGWQIYWE